MKRNKEKCLPVAETWLEPYSSTTGKQEYKEKAAGLAAHLHITLQLHQDLGGNRYDTEFHEWGAAKDIHVWDEKMSETIAQALSARSAA